MTRRIGYNSQRGNATVNGLHDYQQCFSTSAWMLMSHYSNKINATDDTGLASYVKYVETKLGPTIEKVLHPSYHFSVQTAAIREKLKDIPGKVVCNLHAHVDVLPNLLQDGPVIIGTNKIGSLPNGHIILLVDYEKVIHSFIVNDPFGEAMGKYKDHNGDSVLYPLEYILPYLTTNIIYFEED